MAITENEYTGNGSTVLYSFTFPYLEVADIKVSLDGTLTTAYTLANATTVQFNTAPANGVAIRLFRQTNDDALNAQFFPGSAIRSTDLNNNFTQNLYVTQESNRDATQGITTADAATATANTALSNSSAAVSTANTASSNASAAVSTANTASSNASAAVSTANTASSNATTAVSTANAATATANSAASDAATAISTANSALSTANTASTTATNAVNTANSASSAASSAVSTANTASSNASAAVSTANTASSNATSAVNTANSALSTANAAASAVANAILYDIVANVAAIPASPANNDAVEVIDSTGIESFTPLTSIPGGFAGNSGLSVRIVYTTTGNTWTWIQYFPNDPETRYLKEAVTTSDTAPVSPSDGDLWYDSVGGRTYVYYDDGAGSQWVDTSPQGSGVSDAISEGDTSAEVIDTGSDGRFVVTTEGTERLRVDPSGRLLVGTSSARATWAFSTDGSLQVERSNYAAMQVVGNANTTSGAYLSFLKSRGGAIGGTTIVQNNDELGWISFEGMDGANPKAGAAIVAFVDGTPGANDMPGRLVFSTTSDGASSPTERLRITSAGLVGIGTTSPGDLSSDANNFVLGSGSGTKGMTIYSGTANNGNIFFADGTGANAYAGYIQFSHNADLMKFGIQGQDAMYIDSSRRVLVGTSTARSNFFNTTASAALQIEGTATARRASIISCEAASDTGGSLVLAHQRSGAGGGNTIVNNGDIVGRLSYQGNDGAEFVEAASINCEIDGTPGANDMPGRLVFSTTADGASTPTERVRIDSSGRVGIGTTAPRSLLSFGNATETNGINLYDNSGNYRAGIGGASTYLRFYAPSSGAAIQFGRLSVSDGSTFLESGRFDDSGRLLVGTSSTRTVGFWDTPQVQIEGLNYQESSLSIYNNQDFTYGAVLALGHSRGTSNGSNTVVQNNDYLGTIVFYGSDGSNEVRGAEIAAYVDGTPGTNDMPGRLVFSTTADGASSPTERMRLNSEGRLTVPGVWDFSTSSGTTVVVTSEGYIRKAASSIKYKTDIEDLQDSYADQILNIRPVWYRSLCDGDDPNHSYWGFIAEEVAKIDPRLTTWKFHNVSYDENGSRTVTKLDNPEPEGVAYDRFVPHLLNLIKRQQQAIETLEATNASLEARLTALEGGTN
jgi:hypothetical protein